MTDKLMSQNTVQINSEIHNWLEKSVAGIQSILVEFQQFLTASLSNSSM